MRRGLSKKETTAACNLYGHDLAGRVSDVRERATKEGIREMATSSMKSAMAQFMAEMETAKVPVMLDAEKWNKDELPLLVGELIEYKHIIMKTGDEFDQVVVQTEKDGLLRFSMTMGIRTQWEELLPQVGETIGLKFCGSVQTLAGNTFNQFILRVMGRDAMLPGLAPTAGVPSSTADVDVDADADAESDADPFADQ